MCHAGDVKFAETCVASIRRWNKTIPISLHKDESKSHFNTSHIEDNFNVSVCDSSMSSCGSFLSPLFYVLQGADVKKGERLFIHDSDILWLGNVIPLLERSSAQMVVQGQIPEDKRQTSHGPKELLRFSTYSSKTEDELKKIYFEPTLWMKKTGAPLPQLVFNCGHYVIEIGSLNWDDFNDLIIKFNEKWQPITGLKLGDQGATNFAVSRKTTNANFKLDDFLFSIWPNNHHPWLDRVDTEQPAIVHWAGILRQSTRRTKAGHLWRHYRREYYSQFPHSQLHYSLWLLRDFWWDIWQRIKNIRLTLLGKSQFKQ